MRSTETMGVASWVWVMACLTVVGGCSAGVGDDTVPTIPIGGLSENGTNTVVMGCADGTVEQDFGRGMVGCAGNVTWGNRATLCAPGFDVASAKVWNWSHGAVAPMHHYWTNDDLHFAGMGSGNCSAEYGTGTACTEGQPMRVCASTTTDPEGNHCGWVNCGLHSMTPDYFGGCNGDNVTAGTLCVAHGCADGTIEQTFTKGMIGCAGKVTNASALQLCAAGYVLAGHTAWTNYRAGAVPAHDYWTSDGPRYHYGTAASCVATTDTGATACPATSPMRVCTAVGTDPEGNNCNWVGCGASWATSPANQYFGGCSGNLTAGALCVPYKGCADGTTEQNFGTFLIGCAGAVTFDQRETLCGPYTVVAPSDRYISMHGTLTPTHDYWTNDVLRRGGSATSNCYASATSGIACPANQPMHICTASGTDPESNSCTWTHCGFDSTMPDHFLGGCGGPTAGVICETGP